MYWMKKNLKNLTKLKVMIKMARKTYLEGQIEQHEYIQLVDRIEADFLNIVEQLEEKEMSEILDEYILDIT